MRDEVPTAVVVADGKVPGDVPGAPGERRPPGAQPRRRLSNLLLDRSLQLRYVLVVTLVSALITVALGTLVYRQMDRASANVEAGVEVFDDAEFQQELAADLHARDREVMFALAGAGCGLAVVLSLYLLVMTHRVAGPLRKVANHFDELAEGRLGVVTPLRKHDLLTDFFEGFREMHDAVRARATSDADTMARAAATLRATAGDDPALAAELDRLARHVDERRRAVA